MSRQTRRAFLQQTAAGGIAAAFTISGTKASGRIIGANDRIRLGVAGIHGRGASHIDAFAGMKFVGNDQANALLTRQYREPFVVTKVA